MGRRARVEHLFVDLLDERTVLVGGDAGEQDLLQQSGHGRCQLEPCPAGNMPISSTTIRSMRQIRATVRATDASALARSMVAVSVSRVNQVTLRSLSIAV